MCHTEGMTHFTRAFLLTAGIFVTTGVFAQPPQPAAPAKFKVTLRYRILAPRDPHVIAYDGMIKHLKGLGFEFDPPLDQHPDTDREDRSKNYLRGSIVPKNALKLLDAQVVQSLLLVPDGFDLPMDADAPVLVRLELSGKMEPDRQREFANQTRVILRELGFKEAVGYDHRGYTRRPQSRIVGAIPKGKLDLLLRDLRNHPAGWLGPVIPRDELPVPFRDINPVQVIEVLADTAGVKEIPDAPSRGIEAFDKITPELWALISDKDAATTPVRVQIGYVGHIAPEDRDWKNRLVETIPGIFVEGNVGQFAIAVLRHDQVKQLALQPNISVLRLPFTNQVNVDPGIKIKGDDKKALEQTKLTELHERGYTGKGVRVGIIDRDFRGWEKLVKAGKLPAKTRLVDLTTELDPDVYAKPYAGDPDEPGHGTLCAQATALAAPEAEIVLIRVETIDPYHLEEVVRYVQGGAPSALIEKRDGEQVARLAKLRARRAELIEERRVILNDFTDETDQKEYLSFLGEVYSWLYSDRDWHRKRMEAHDAFEAEQSQRENRLFAHMKTIRTLEGIPVLVNAWSWHSGYSLGSNSPLSKRLDDPKGPLWFQPVSNTRGQTWLGPFRHTPGDPSMKFTDDADKLPPGRWSNEVNFLAWQTYKGEAKTELPEKTRLRVTLQWREPHDPDYFNGDDDPYRKPLAQMGVMLLRQRDAEGKTLPGDTFELVARTLGQAQRIEHLPRASVYEHVLETTVEKGGRCAVRIEKQVSTQWRMIPHPIRKSPMFDLLKDLTPTGIRPLGAPTLTALEKNWDLQPRLFVEVIDEANRVHGRAVLADYWTDGGSIGIPADARNVISVGAASFKDEPQPYSAFGSPAGSELARRPWLYAYDELDLAGGGAFGTSVANAFAAGTVAAMLSAELPREELFKMLRAQEGRVLRVPIGKK